MLPPRPRECLGWRKLVDSKSLGGSTGPSFPDNLERCFHPGFKMSSERRLEGSSWVPHLLTQGEGILAEVSVQSHQLCQMDPAKAPEIHPYMGLLFRVVHICSLTKRFKNCLQASKPGLLLNREEKKKDFFLLIIYAHVNP